MARREEIIAPGAWRHAAGHGVGRRLAQLPRPDWVVVHDLPIGRRGAHVDHLVIGPPRCFAFTTLQVSGPVVVDGKVLLEGGRPTSHLPRAAHEAATIQRRLLEATGIDPNVRAVIVVHGGRLTVREQPRDVTVLSSVEVPGWLLLQAGRQELTPGAIAALETAARDSATWPIQRSSDEAADPRPQTSPSALSVTRWQHGGQDRWYVNLADGTTLGHLDATTGEIVADRPQDRSLVRAVLRRDGAPMVPDRSDPEPPA